MDSWYQRNKEKHKANRRLYYQKNKAREIANTKVWKEDNKDLQRAYNAKYQKNNKENNRLAWAKYYSNNSEKEKTRRKENYKNNKAVNRSYGAKRRASLLQQTPKWADLKAIKEFYINCPFGYHVDHIIPLQGKNVRGLHVLENLQYLPASENLKKSNKIKS